MKTELIARSSLLPVGRPGFASAPLTKGIMLFVGVSSLGVGLLHWKPYLPLILDPHIITHHQVRPLASPSSRELPS